MAVRRRGNKTIVKTLLEKGEINQAEANQLLFNKKRGNMPLSVVEEATRNAVASKPASEEERDWNGKCQEHIVKVFKIPKPLIDNPKSVNRAVEDYFHLVAFDKVKPSVAGLSLALGISRRTLLDWANGTTRISNKEVIDRALQMIEMYDEMSLRDSSNSKANPIGTIFLMKNNYGYADKTEVVHTKEDTGKTEKELKEKYAEAIDVACEDVK